MMLGRVAYIISVVNSMVLLYLLTHHAINLRQPSVPQPQELVIELQNNEEHDEIPFDRCDLCILAYSWKSFVCLPQYEVNNFLII